MIENFSWEKWNENCSARKGEKSQDWFMEVSKGKKKLFLNFVFTVCWYIWAQYYSNFVFAVCCLQLTSINLGKALNQFSPSHMRTSQLCWKPCCRVGAATLTLQQTSEVAGLFPVQHFQCHFYSTGQDKIILKHIYMPHSKETCLVRLNVYKIFPIQTFFLIRVDIMYRYVNKFTIFLKKLAISSSYLCQAL